MKRTFPTPQAREAMDRAVSVNWTVPAGDTGFQISSLTVKHPNPQKSGAEYVCVLLLDLGMEGHRSNGAQLYTYVEGTNAGWDGVFEPRS